MRRITARSERNGSPLALSSERSLSDAYHGQVLEGASDDDETDAKGDWFAGKLKFRRHIDDQFRFGADGNRGDDYATIDSRRGGEDAVYAARGGAKPAVFDGGYERRQQQSRAYDHQSHYGRARGKRQS